MNRSRRDEQRDEPPDEPPSEHLLVIVIAAVVCFAGGFLLGIFPHYALLLTISATLFVVWRWKQRADKAVLLTPVVAFAVGQIALQIFGLWYRKQP